MLHGVLTSVELSTYKPSSTGCASGVADSLRDLLVRKSTRGGSRCPHTPHCPHSPTVWDNADELNASVVASEKKRDFMFSLKL